MSMNLHKNVIRFIYLLSADLNAPKKKILEYVVLSPSILLLQGCMQLSSISCRYKSSYYFAFGIYCKFAPKIEGSTCKVFFHIDKYISGIKVILDHLRQKKRILTKTFIQQIDHPPFKNCFICRKIRGIKTIHVSSTWAAVAILYHNLFFY